jgi:hypothetical protein
MVVFLLGSSPRNRTFFFAEEELAISLLRECLENTKKRENGAPQARFHQPQTNKSHPCCKNWWHPGSSRQTLNPVKKCIQALANNHREGVYK